MFDKKLIGKRLRELRELHKLTLEEVAKTIQSSKGTLSNIELGKKPVSLDMAISLAEYFNVSLDFLLGNLDTSEPAIVCQPSSECQPAMPNDCLDTNKEVHISTEDTTNLLQLINNLDSESIKELRKYLNYLNARQCLEPETDERSAGFDVRKVK